MRICYFVCSNLFGGVENIVVKSLNALSKMHDVALIAPKNLTYKDKLDKSVKIYEYKSFDKRYNPFLFLEIYKFAKDYDIIHTHGSKATQIFYVLNKILNKKFVATKHNVRKGKIFNRVKNVISVSKMVADTIKQNSKVLYFGMEKISIEPKKLSDKFSIVAVGRLDFIKGFDELIMAARNLKFDFDLFIIGEGEQKQSLKKLIDNLDLNNSVHLLGFRDDVKEILSGANLQVISSRSEGMPNTLFEGIFYSNLLISTNVGGIGEILESDFLFDMSGGGCEQKIVQIKQNYNEFADRFSIFASIMQERFSFERYLFDLLKYYEDLK